MSPCLASRRSLFVTLTAAVAIVAVIKPLKRIPIEPISSPAAQPESGSREHRDLASPARPADILELRACTENNC